uniref:Uncharacterized protein n=1 Tax=Glossina brevipalpis TaxID=37001 RepID=A0A1A9WXP3_9MUSC
MKNGSDINDNTFEAVIYSYSESANLKKPLTFDLLILYSMTSSETYFIICISYSLYSVTMVYKCNVLSKTLANLKEIEYNNNTIKNVVAFNGCLPLNAELQISLKPLEVPVLPKGTSG